MNIHHRTYAALLGLIGLSLAPLAIGDTPDRINYQGVLRDTLGVPRNGTFDMTFRFLDAPVGPSEILVDAHIAAGTGDVPVYDGLFEVWLGTGAVTDGVDVVPGDPYTTLAEMFSTFPEVWLEIEIDGEVLSPRVLINSVPYALHAQSSVYADEAGTVGGFGVSDFLNTSTTPQTKAGPLRVNGSLTAGGDQLLFSGGVSGARILTFSTGIEMWGGDSDTDRILIVPGNDITDGRLDLSGDSAIGLYAGNGIVRLGDAATGLINATTDAAGGFTVRGDLTALGDDVLFGAPGARLQAHGSGLDIWGGDGDTDRIILRPGNDNTDGSIDMLGDGDISIRAGNGVVQLVDASTGFVNAWTDSTGSFSVRNDLVATGNELRFGAPGASLTATTAQVELRAGDADGDDLLLSAGNDTTDGGIEIQGDGAIELRAGNGAIDFIHAGSGLVLATVGPTGDLRPTGDLVINGNELRFGATGPRLTATTTQIELLAGDADGDDLLLTAGNEQTDGSIDIFGDNQITFRAGNGVFGFVNGSNAASVATIRDSATQGYEMHLGPIGSTRIVRNPVSDDLYFARDEDQNQLTSTFSIFANVGVMQMRINDGDEAPAFFDGAVNVNGIDYAEAFSITDPTLEAGDVVVFDPARAGYVSRATTEYSRLVAGVISEKPGFVTGGSFDAEEAADPELADEMRAAYAANDYGRAKEIALALEARKKEVQRPVALVGRLPVKVDATYGEIRAGDHLTSSGTPGHAMAMKEAGPSIGVALESFSGPGTGVVLAFVQRGHYTPAAMVTETMAAQEELARTVDARTPDPASGVQVLPSSLQLVLDGSGGQDSRFSIFRDGKSDEPRAEVFRVDERGNVWAQGAFRPRSMDLAETFAVSEEVEPGDVLVADREQKGRYAKGRRAADTGAIGVVATDPGVLLGGDVSRVLDESPELALALADARARLDRAAEQAVWAELERRFQASYAAVALSGTVPVKVDAAYGAIEPGDLLISSPTPGHAMRAPDPAPAGAVIGKALEAIEVGTGTIRMIVMLR